MTPPNPNQFVPNLNLYDCSKVSDGASSLIVLSEEGLARSGLSRNEVIEIVGIGEAEGDITEKPNDLTVLSTTHQAAQQAIGMSGIGLSEIGLLEVHDCFSITGLLALEAIGFAEQGRGAQFILEHESRIGGKIPTNLSGGLGGFGHPTGASGVRQMVDLLHQFTGKAANQIEIQKPYGMMVSMGGNDKTVTCFIVSPAEY
jgi:acetyl-CoA C-acetyltransferase